MKHDYSSHSVATAIPESVIDPDTLHEALRLFRARWSLLPLGENTKGKGDGKEPSMSFKDSNPLPFSKIKRRMEETPFHSMYGIRLPGMLVIDLDNETTEALAYIEKHFPVSDYRVKTSRGWHFYYRFEGIAPAKIELPNIKIDFKAGPNAYVVGPYSVRPDNGFRYLPNNHPLERKGDLPAFYDRRPAQTKPKPNLGLVRDGDRNDTLFRRGLRYAHICETLDELIGDLLRDRDIHCESPQEFSDAEVKKISKSIWKYKTNGTLWGGKDSGVKIKKSIIQTFAAMDRDGCYANMLYDVLVANHGHIPGQQFPIHPESMRRAGTLVLADKIIYRARDMLIEAGLLISHGRAEPNSAIRYELVHEKNFGFGDEDILEQA